MNIYDIFLYCAAALASIIGCVMFRVKITPEKGKEVIKGSEKLPSRSVGSIVFIPILLVNLMIITVLKYFYGQDNRAILETIFLASGLWSIAYIDYKLHLIPNKLLVVLLIIRAVLLGIAMVSERDFFLLILSSSAIACVAMLVASGLCYFVSPGSVGMGDIKLLSITGLFMGINKIAGVIFPTLFIMFIVCVFLLVSKKADRKSEIAFAPFLLAGLIAGALVTGV